MGLDIDRSNWPLVVYRIDGDVSEAMTDAYVQGVKENISRAEESGVKYVSIVVSDSMRTNANIRQALAGAIEEHDKRIRAACLGNALVTTSTVSRGLLTALTWLTKMPVPVTVHKTVEDAKAWAQEIIDKAEEV